MSKHIMMVVNDTNFAWNLRREVLEAFVKKGYQVTLVAEILNFKNELEAIGLRIINVKVRRHGMNPVQDIKLFFSYLMILRNEKPDIVLTNNIKPNVYVGISCQLLHINYMTNVCGLGTPGETHGKLQKLTTRMYKVGVRKASVIFFQNEENKSFFEHRKMIGKNTRVVLTPGSGVNLKAHPLLPWNCDGKTHFLFAARIMKEKGIDLFLAAARKYASENVIFDVCGQCDDEGYQKILENEKSVKYHGLQKNLTPYYRDCSCFLYPSYYPEGMSNVLLEAAASGRPAIAADRAGCREIVIDGVTGFIVPVNDGKAVLEAVEKFLHLSNKSREKMGLVGRKKIVEEFDRQIVVKLFMKEIEMILFEETVRWSH